MPRGEKDKLTRILDFIAKQIEDKTKAEALLSVVGARDRIAVGPYPFVYLREGVEVPADSEYGGEIVVNANIHLELFTFNADDPGSELRRFRQNIDNAVLADVQQGTHTLSGTTVNNAIITTLASMSDTDFSPDFPGLGWQELIYVVQYNYTIGDR